MSLMMCPACHSQMDSDASECPVCRLLNPRITGSVENKNEILNQLARQHQMQILGKLEIGVKAMAHKAAGDRYVLAGRPYVRLFDGKALDFDQVLWCDHPFGQSKQNQAAELDLVIRKEGKDQDLKLRYATPQLDDLWYVGIALKEGFNCSLLIGNEETASETETFSLLTV